MGKPKKKLHRKPSQEELKDNIEKATQELEKEDEVSPEELEASPDELEGEEQGEGGEPEIPEEPVEAEEEEEPPKPESVDYKKRFIESTKQAQILHHKNKKLSEALDKAREVPEPTEDELKKEYSDWEDMSDFEKKMARDSLISTQRFEALEKVNKEFKDLESWQDKVNEFIDDPATLVEYSGLEGKRDEFRFFAGHPTRINSDFEVLVKSFLYDEEQQKKTSKKKGKMFETGSGGSPSKPKPEKISIERAIYLRENDYKEYKRLLLAGKLQMVP